MNKDRRKRLDEAIELLESAKGIIEEVKDEEQDSFDNLSENLQTGEKGEKMENAISSLENAFDSLDSAIEEIGNAKE